MRDVRDQRSIAGTGSKGHHATSSGAVPGKHTLTENLLPASSPVQRKAAASAPEPATPQQPPPSMFDVFGGVQRKEADGEQQSAAGRADASALGPQASGAGRAGSSAEPANAQFASATSGGGSELPHRAEMEQAFGEDFSGVQAHVGRASEMHALRAHAAAQGERVAFADASPSREVVAHELAHVVQGRRAGASAAPQTKAVSSPNDPAEQEADRVAADVVAGRPVTVVAAPSAGVHRLATNEDYHQLAARGDALREEVFGWHIANPITYATYQAEFPNLGATFEALPADRDGVIVYCALLRQDGSFRGHPPNPALGWIAGNPGPFVSALEIDAVPRLIIPFAALLPVNQLRQFLVALDRSQAAMFIEKVVKNAGVPHATMANFIAAADAVLTAPPAGLPTWSRALCMSIKYNIQFPLSGEAAHGNAAPESDFNDTALRQIEQTLNELPSRHVVDNRELRRIVREKDRSALLRLARGFGMTMGAHGGDGELSLDYYQKGGKYVDRTTTRITGAPGRTQFAEANDPNAQTDSVFRFTLRHEMGHAVEQAIGASGYTQTPAGGAWITYGDHAAAATAILAAAGDAHTVDATARLTQRGVAANAFIEAVLARRMGPKESVRTHVLAVAANHAALQPADISYLVDQLTASQALTIIDKGRFSGELGPWLREGDRPVANGRVFHQSYDEPDGWTSYDLSARDRKVSKYQFRSQGEWFAEAYSAYYEPSPPAQNFDAGYKLKQRDPVTWAWFRTRVHNAVTAPQPNAAPPQPNAAPPQPNAPMVLDAATNTQSANALMTTGNPAVGGNQGGAATYAPMQAAQLAIQALEQLVNDVASGAVAPP